MKKKVLYKLNLIGVFLLFFCFAFSVEAAAESENLEIRIEIPQVIINKVTRPEGNFSQLEFENASSFSDSLPGSAQIPFITKFIALPHNAKDINIETKIINDKIFHDILIYPASKKEFEKHITPTGDTIYEQKETFCYDMPAYESSEINPKNIVEILEDGFLRSQRLIKVRVNPLRYNAKERILYFAEEIDLTISFDVHVDPSGFKNTLGNFSNLARSLVLNPQAINSQGQIFGLAGVSYLEPRDLTSNDLEIDYLVLTSSDFYSSDELLNLANYRANKNNYRIGIAKVEDIYDEYPAADNDMSIKNFISFAYHNWVLAPSYLLLLGDVARVPTHLVPSGFIGDVSNDDWFAYVEGDDSWPEMAVGRISARELSHLINITEKIICYENVEQGDFHEDALLVDTTNPNIDLWNMLFHAGYELTELWQGVDYGKDEFLKAFGSGYAYLKAHGSPQAVILGFPDEFYFYADQVSEMFNKLQYPILFSMSCSTADISDSPTQQCLGERLVNESKKGAVAYYGATSIVFANLIPDVALDAILNDFQYSLGEVLLYAEMNGGTGDWGKSQILLGDPALHVLGHDFAAGLPDLTLASEDFDYDADSKIFSLTITNLGSASAQNVPVKVFILDEDMVEHLFVDIIVDEVEAGSEKNLTIKEVSLPIDNGENPCIVKIDPENQIEESFELNNNNGRIIDTLLKSTITCLDDEAGPVEGMLVKALDCKGRVIAEGRTDSQGQAQLGVPQRIFVRFQIFDHNLLAAESDFVGSPCDLIFNLHKTSITVLDKDSEPVARAVLKIFNDDNQLLDHKRTDSHGEAAFYLLEQALYRFEIWHETALSVSTDYYAAPCDLTLFLPEASLIGLTFGVIPVEGGKVYAYDNQGNQVAGEAVTNSVGLVELYLKEDMSTRFEIWKSINTGPLYSECLSVLSDFVETPYSNIFTLPDSSHCVYIDSDGREVEGLDLKVFDPQQHRELGFGQTGANFLLQSGMKAKFRVEVAENDFRWSEIKETPNDFVVNAYCLNIAIENGSVSIDPARSTYAQGEEVTIYAEVFPGYAFDQWSGDTDCISGSTQDNPVLIIMNGEDTNKSLTAEITQIPSHSGL